MSQIPDWLHRSDVWVEMYSGNGDDGFPMLPVCDIECADAVHMYLVLGAWCMPWRCIPTTFFSKWWKLTPEERGATITQYTYFAEELDETHWVDRMFLRDDVALLDAAIVNDYVPPTNVVKQAIEADAADCLDRLLEKGMFRVPPDVFNAALHIHEGYLSYQVMAACESVKCMIVAQKYGYWITDWAMKKFVEHGRVDCLKYALEHGGSWRDTLCDIAAACGQLECIRYANEHGYGLSGGVLFHAMNDGHLPCVVYAYQHGCTWSTEDVYQSIYNGHVDCLVYAVEHGCPIDSEMFVSAVVANHVPILEYMIGLNHPGSSKVCPTAAAYGMIRTLRYAHRKGLPWGDTCDRAAGVMWNGGIASGKLECLRYACEHGCPWNEDWTEEQWCKHLNYIHMSPDTIAYVASIKCPYSFL